MEVEPDNHLLYSNRSLCHASLHHFDEALADAKECIRLSPEWVSPTTLSPYAPHSLNSEPRTLQGKGYGRAAAAYKGLGNFREAMASYRKGLEKEPGIVHEPDGKSKGSGCGKVHCV